MTKKRSQFIFFAMSEKCWKGGTTLNEHGLLITTCSR